MNEERLFRILEFNTRQSMFLMSMYVILMAMADAEE
jgi:hypothetical protein